MQPFPAGGAVTSVSTGPGREPVWSKMGAELFYRDGDRMMAVDVVLAPEFSAEIPRVLFEADYATDPVGLGVPNYDVAPDGRFLMLSGGDNLPSEIHVVVNWDQELLERVPLP